MIISSEISSSVIQNSVLAGVTFYQTNLESNIFKNNDMPMIAIIGAKFSGNNFVNSKIVGAQFSDNAGEKNVFTNSPINNTIVLNSPSISTAGAGAITDLKAINASIDLSYHNLSYINLSGINLDKVNFSHSLG